MSRTPKRIESCRLADTRRRACAVLLVLILATSGANADYEFLRIFGGQGVGAGQFELPGQVSEDGMGNLLISDEDLDRVQICDYMGNCTILGGGNPPSFNWPFGVDGDSTGRIAVLEHVGNRMNICMRDVSGDCAVTWGMQGNALGDFDLARGIVIDEDDTIIIADRNNDRIQLCDDAGSCTAFGGFSNTPGVTGKFWDPRGVAVDGLGNIIVADSGNNRIQVCDYTGDCTEFGEFGDALGQFYEPHDVAVDYAGRIVVADTRNHRIQVCTYDGDCTAFGEQGPGNGQFNFPKSVEADALGNIFVSDALNHAIQVFHDGDYSAAAFVINAGLNDAWVAEGAPFQGFFFTVYPLLKIFFLSWFTFDSVLPTPPDTAVFGAWDTRWVTAAGSYDGDTATLSVELTSGGAFNTSVPLAMQTPNYGTITIVFISCNEALLTYNFPSLGLSGQITLKRVVDSNVALCETLMMP